jgi:hypothetical protein
LRIVLDHSDAVSRLAVVDIVPIKTIYATIAECERGIGRGDDVPGIWTNAHHESPATR